MAFQTFDCFFFFVIRTYNVRYADRAKNATTNVSKEFTKIMSKGQAKQLAVLPTLFLGDEKESLPEQLKGWEYVDLRLIDDGERYTTIHRIILCLVVVVVVVLLLPFHSAMWT